MGAVDWIFFLKIIWRSYKPLPCRAAHTGWAKHGSSPRPLRVRLSIVRLPREPFFIYGGKEIMTTYHQDIMTNFSCVHDRFTVYPFFRVVFQNMHKRTCPCQLFKVFTLRINFTTILFKINTKNSQWF